MNEPVVPRRSGMRDSDTQHRRKCLSRILLQDIPPLPFPCQRGRPGSPAGCESPVCAGSTANLPPPFRTSSEFANEPRVSFHRNVSSQQLHQIPLQTQVIGLPWTDGKYTGQVNELIQPHGVGWIQYRNGTVLTGTWCNGMSLRKTYAPALNRVVHPSPRARALVLGDIATPQDMHIEPDPQKAHENAASLLIHSFAFILRSNGEWSYAILANRPVESGPEASLRFVLDTEGRTKILKSKYWSRCIRLVNDSESQKVSEETRREDETIPSNKDLARLNSFQRAVRRVSLDMSTKTLRS